MGIIFFITLFSFLISWKDNYVGSLKNKIFCFIFVGIFIIQIGWSFSAMRFDYYNNYCASKDAAEFIKDNNLDKSKIYTLSNFKTLALNPYFEKNIYLNSIGGKSYNIWIKNREDNFFVSDDFDVLVFSKQNYENENYLTKIDENKYKKYTFNADMIFKNKIRESNAFFLYVRKDLIK
ncbi:hypothetical protein IJ818_08115 [bacterium]|nr:hypothetical protein [bacterium]